MMTKGDDAADKANKKAGSKTIAGTCTTGKCDPECPILSQQIESQAQLVQKRLEDMVIDKHDLYNTARTLADDWGKGSWEGHQSFYNIERDTLKGLIALADAKGCPVSLFAREVANETAPSQPGY